jgi:hypothetical protein
VELTRRTVLATTGLTGLGALGACTDDGRPARPRRPAQAPDPDVVVATEALSAVHAALALVEATSQRHPALVDRLEALGEAHREHLSVLDDAVPEDGPSPDVAPSPSGGLQAPDPAPQGTETSAPQRPAEALARVVASEAATTVQLKRLAFRARSGAFARLLGSVAASGAQHAAVLSGPGTRP